MEYNVYVFIVDAEEEGEESKWQDRISSGFDRLVAFASTELDKRRRSTEGGESCNTSPDSGIGHCNQSPATNALPVVKKTEPYKLKPNLKPSMFKTPSLKQNVDSSPVMEQQFIDDTGPPRTPSPSASPTCNQLNYTPLCYHPSSEKNNIIRVSPALFKYQRQESEKKQARPDHHYKKKFYYREWRGNKGEGSWENETDDHNNDAANAQKGSSHNKFHQKPQDWEWNNKNVNPEYANAKLQNNDTQWMRSGLHDMYNVSNSWKN